MKRWRLIIALVSSVLLAVAMSAPAAVAAEEGDIEAAIADGIAWLATQQNTSVEPGSWGEYERTAHTAFALIKLQDRATELGMDPFDPEYEYADEVEAGWRYLMAHSTTVTIDAQDHTASGGTLDDPDVDGDGEGIYFYSGDSGTHHAVYATGLALMAMKASGDPDREADTYGYPTDVTFGDLAQDTADWLAWAQGDVSFAEGGWGYSALDDAYDHTDNSNSGYATLGLAAAQSFGCTVPDWVKAELAAWLPSMQDPVDGDGNDGGGVYTPFDGWVNELKTGNLLFEFTFVGMDDADQAFQETLDYIARHWQDADHDPGWGYSMMHSHYQAMFCLMKGFEYSDVDLIDLDGVDEPEHDWYSEFADALVAQQQPDGRWTGGSWGNDVLDTCWALLTLERVSPPPPVTPVTVDVKPMSWPNPFQMTAKGTLPVAILGTAEVDAATIDPTTCMLVGVAPVRWALEDVGTPGMPLAGPDGMMDLTLKYDRPAMATALSPVVHREERTVQLTGAFMDGQAIYGEDVIVILMK